MAKKPYKSIPKKGRSDPQVDAIAANLELLTGQIGRGNDRAVLISDLEDLGLARFGNGSLQPTLPDAGGGAPIPDPTNPVDPPTRPTNVVVNAGFTAISVQWDTASYNGHAYAEVFMSTTDDFSTSARIGVTGASIFGYSVDFDYEGYIWVRFVNELGQVGPINDAAGTHFRTQSYNPPPPIPVQPPTQPTNVATNGIYAAYEVTWDVPTYDGHAYTEVWANTVNNVATASEVGTAVSGFFTKPEQFGWTGFVWVRHVNANNVTGAWQSTNGVPVTVQGNVDDIIDEIISDLDGRITEPMLDPNLNWQMDSSQENIDKYILEQAEAAIDETIAQDGWSMVRREGEKTLRATLVNDYYTKVGSDEAIAAATLSMKTEIEDPNGDSLGATLANQYYTKVDTDGAIAAARTELKAEIEDPNGSSLGATLANNYYTSVETDSAISVATTQLKSDIEDPDGSSIGADLKNNYFTQTETNSAIAAATTALKTEIEDPNGTSLGATLSNQYYTKTATDSAIAVADTQLKADIENPTGSSLGATLRNNYYTRTATDSAISSATTTLKSDIENPNGSSLGATLRNNYYTRTATDQAISSAISTVKAEIEDPNGSSVGSQVDQVSQALAETDGYLSALWGVKVTAGDVTASIGLVAKSNPSNPDITNAYFVVKDADFRVYYSKNPGDADETEVASIFGTMDNPDYNPSDPNSPKKILVIDTASIKVASIRDLTVGSVVADEVVANISISSPVINGGRITIGNNFTVNDQGNMTFNNFTGRNGALTGRMNVGPGGTGYIDGDNTPIENYFIGTSNNNFFVRHNGYLYAKEGEFAGSVYASKILGDVVGAKAYSRSDYQLIRNGSGSATSEWFSFKVHGNPTGFLNDRVVTFQAFEANISVFVDPAGDNQGSANGRFRVQIYRAGDTSDVRAEYNSDGVFASGSSTNVTAREVVTVPPLTFEHPRGTADTTYNVRFTVWHGRSGAVSSSNTTLDVDAAIQSVQIFAESGQLS